jgi:hypothetical protein
LFVSVARSVTGRAPWIGGLDHLTHRAARLTGSVRQALALWVVAHAVLVLLALVVSAR